GFTGSGGPADPTVERPSDRAGLGATVTQILGLAEAESTEVRHAATRQAEAILAEARVAADELRSQADRYATNRRATSEQDALATLDDAHDRADELLAQAERRLLEAREKSEQVQQQAQADVETVQARREQLEKDLHERLHLAREQAE